MAKKKGSRRSFRRSFSGGGRKIPMAVVAGAIPGVSWSVQPIQQGRTWDEVWQRFIAAYTGYSYAEKKWSSFYLTKGLFPVFGGMLAHGLANYLGINRTLARFHLPVEI